MPPLADAALQAKGAGGSGTAITTRKFDFGFFFRRHRELSWEPRIRGEVSLRSGVQTAAAAAGGWRGGDRETRQSGRPGPQSLSALLILFIRSFYPLSLYQVVEVKVQLQVVEVKVQLQDVEVKVQLQVVEVKVQLQDVEVKVQLQDVEVKVKVHLQDVEVKVQLQDVKVKVQLKVVEVKV